MILDSDHSEAHVSAELETYAPFVTEGNYLLCQDGCLDELEAFEHATPGPLAAIRKFLASHPQFEPAPELNERFLISHHPMGWMRRIRAER